jgi:hypothetical protein
MSENKHLKRCIISLADGANKAYKNGHARLIGACQKHFSGKLILINDYNKIGSPSHEQNPYAFKIYCIEYAYSLGYDTVLYLDSSLYPIKNCDAVFDYIEANGHLMQEAGHWWRTWTNNAAKEYFKPTDEELEKQTLYSAGFTGLSFKNERSVQFFNQWKQSMLDGIFKGVWQKKHRASDFTNCPGAEGHRHDMTCASIIATRLGMKFETDLYMAYIGGGYVPAPEFTYFYCHPC